MLIPREYFTLNEVLADWWISESELGYVVEMGQLTLSVRIYGSFTAAYGRARSAQPIPDFEGVVDLERRDAMRVLRKQACPVPAFRSPAPSMIGQVISYSASLSRRGLGVSETLCMRLSPCRFDGSSVEPFWV